MEQFILVQTGGRLLSMGGITGMMLSMGKTLFSSEALGQPTLVAPATNPEAQPDRHDDERRNNQRMPIEMSAVLNYNSHAQFCTVRDISPTGAFIETDPSELPLSRTVELGMSIETRNGTKYYRLPVLIRRVTEGGAGVSFGDIERETYFNLVDLVFRA
jgi:hypothetical protein